jgi:hypothetical protein
MTFLPRVLGLLLTVAALAATPRLVAAQEGGFPVATTANSQFVMLNGEVVHRQGSQTTALSQNVKLAGGTKINYKNGIVELPGGKKTTLHEGDYVKPDGGIVFATPASAAAARGEKDVPADTQYDKYVQVGGAPGNSGEMETRINSLDQRVELMARKIKLLNEKITVMSKTKQKLPNTAQLDQQIKALDAQLAQVK